MNIVLIFSMEHKFQPNAKITPKPKNSDYTSKHNYHYTIHVLPLP